MNALLLAVSNIQIKRLYHIKVAKDIQIPYNEYSWPQRKVYSLEQVIEPWEHELLQHRLFDYFSTVNKKEMEGKYLQKQIQEMAIVKWIKICAKSRFTFHRNRGSV